MRMHIPRQTQIPSIFFCGVLAGFLFQGIVTVHLYEETGNQNLLLVFLYILLMYTEPTVAAYLVS